MRLVQPVRSHRCFCFTFAVPREQLLRQRSFERKVITCQHRTARATPGVNRNRDREVRSTAKYRQYAHDFYEKDLPLVIQERYQGYAAMYTHEGLDKATETGQFFREFARFAVDWSTMSLHPMRQAAFETFLASHMNEKGLTITDLRLGADSLSEAKKSAAGQLRHRFKQYMSAAGHIDFTSDLLNSAQAEHKLGGENPARDPEMTLERRRLQAFARDRSHEAPRVLTVEAGLLENDGRWEEAIEKYNQLMVKIVEHSELHRAEPQQLFLRGPLTQRWQDLSPWNNIFKAVDDMSNKGQQPSLKAMEMLKGAVEIGIKVDDPEAHFYCARMRQQEYEADRIRENTRSGREEDEFGKSSAWLFHMIKAGVSGYPEAAAELGQFYWTTSWPYLGDEPKDSVKPTPFDRVAPRWNVTSRIGRLIEATGLRETREEEGDIFQSAAMPSSAVQRVSLAYDWFDTAQTSLYAPAIRGLIEINSAPSISSSLGCPEDAIKLKNSRYSYRPTEHFDIPNRLYDEAKAQMLVATAAGALAMRKIWLQASSNKAGKNMRLTTRERFRAATEHIPPEDERFRWVQNEVIYKTWINDHEVCNDFEEYLEQLCQERGWKRPELSI